MGTDLKAAIAVNESREKNDLKPKNNISKKNIEKQKEKKSSKFKYVIPCGNKWKAQLNFNGEQKYLGMYETDLEAALAVNEFCEKNGLEPKNNISKNNIKKQKEKKCSKYNNVTSHGNKRKA